MLSAPSVAEEWVTNSDTHAPTLILIDCVHLVARGRRHRRAVGTAVGLGEFQ
jgi:hypothetical protein